MRIAIDLETFTPKHLGALIAAMFSCGTATREAVAHAIAPLGLVHPPATQPKHTVEALKEFPVSVVIRGVLESAPQFATDELGIVIADLNAELYSRRIQHDDDPSSGVDTGAVMGGPNSAAGAEPVDLAAAFAQAADTHVESVLESRRKNNASGQNGEDAANIKDTFTAMVALDKSGLPWDARIHSASKAINQTDGLWRQKRGVDPALVITVEGDLRQAMSVPAAGGAMVDTDMPAHQLYTDDDADRPDVICDTNGSVVLSLCKVCGRAESELDEQPHCVAREAAPSATIKTPPPPPRRINGQPLVAPPAEPQPTGAHAADTGEIDSFPRLLKFITAQKLAGKINQAQVGAALVSLGIEGPLPVLQSRADLIPAMVTKLRAIGGV